MRRRPEGRGGAGRTNLVRDCRERRSSKQALGRLPLPPSVVVFPSSRARPGPALPSFFSVQRAAFALGPFPSLLSSSLSCWRRGASWRGEKVVD